jgi:hypothetical protein
MSENMTSVFLSGLGSIVVATVITIIYEWRKRKIIERNLLRGFVSKLDINKEYLKHNFDLATLLLTDNSKPPIFVPVRESACTRILTSGEVRLNNDIRTKCTHYLVTVDYLNRMITTIELTDRESKDYKTGIERIKRYCRTEEENYSSDFDYVRKHLNEIRTFFNQ